MNGEAPSLRSYLSSLKKRGRVVTVDAPVSTKFEVAALEKALEDSKAIQVAAPRGGSFPIVANLLLSREDFAEALHRDAKEFESFFQSSVGRGSRPSVVERGSFQEVSKGASLDGLPIVHHFEKDAGAYVTSSIVIAFNRETGTQNMSMHRLLKVDDRHLAIRMVEGRHLHRAFTLAKENDEDLPVAVAIGVHPAVEMAAAFQAPYGYDELNMANALLDGRLETVRVEGGLTVPTHSEIVITGAIKREDTVREYMVEMLGNYDAPREQPVMEVKNVYHRKGAIYRDILPGGREHRMLMSYPVEMKLNKAVKDVIPTVKRVILTDGGCNWLHAVIQMQKRFEGEPKNAIVAAFAAHPSLKMATVVDEDIDPTDPTSVEYAIATRFQASRGLIVVHGAKGSSLDPSADQEDLLTDKMGIDATRTLKKPKEKFERAEIPNYLKTVERLLRGRRR